MKKQTTYTTYLKLPEYIIPLITKRYGTPVVFPESSRLYKVLTSGISSADDINKPYSKISCSQKAYIISTLKGRGQISEDQYPGTPSSSDIELFIPIALPHTITYVDKENRQLVSSPTDDTFVLSLSSAQRMRNLIRQIFWTDLHQFHEDFADSMLRRNEAHTHKNKIYKFLRVHNIPDDMFENVCRTETRLQPEMQ